MMFAGSTLFTLPVLLAIFLAAIALSEVLR